MPEKAKKPRFIARVEGLEARRLLTTSVWTGAAGDHLFSDGSNWQDGMVPASGNDLVFGDLGSSQTVNFDTTGINTGNIEVANAYTFTGNTITLFGEVDAGTNSSATFNNTIVIGGNDTHFSPDTGGSITLQTLSDNSGDNLDKYGAGTLTFDGDSDSTLQVFQGTVTINANTHITLNEFGGQGAVVNGSGAVNNIYDAGGEFFVSNGSGPTTLAGTNNIEFDGGTLNASITNSAHSELTVNSGAVQLNNDPTLSLTLGSGFATTNGTVYTLISNNTNTSVSGTFANDPEGATVTAGGEAFHISYVGGTSGHDVTLTSVAAAPTVTVVSSATTTIVGQSVTLMATVSGTDGTPTGTVTFFNGSTAIGSGTLSGGKATLTTALAAGTGSITAVFGGSSVYTTATSAAVAVAVSSTGPVISVAPSASLATAKAIKLSALGLDTTSALTKGLTYTWTSTKVPSGAKVVKFSVNGTNAASTTDAAVSKDGTYTFKLTVKDSAGRTASTLVQYSVRQIARILDIVPTSVKLAKGKHATFSTTALDQFDHAMRTNSTAVAYTLLSGPGAITTAGVFTASSTKTGKSVIKVTLDGLTGEATVTV